MLESLGHAASVTGCVARFLELGDSDDFERLGRLDERGEGEEGGENGAAQRGGDEVCDALGVGEGGGEGGALGFSVFCEEGVGHGVVCRCEVVEPLRVAHEVDGGGHYGDQRGLEGTAGGATYW